MTQAQAASALRHPQNYISKCERAQRRIEAIELAELAELYGVSVLDLIPQAGTESAARLPRVAEPRIGPGASTSSGGETVPSRNKPPKNPGRRRVKNRPRTKGAPKEESQRKRAPKKKSTKRRPPHEPGV
jgi:hypothetical protein